MSALNEPDPAPRVGFQCLSVARSHRTAAYATPINWYISIALVSQTRLRKKILSLIDTIPLCRALSSEHLHACTTSPLAARRRGQTDLQTVS